MSQPEQIRSPDAADDKLLVRCGLGMWLSGLEFSCLVGTAHAYIDMHAARTDNIPDSDRLRLVLNTSFTLADAPQCST